MEITMQNNSLLDLLASLSLYRTVPGCRIGFDAKSSKSIIVSDEDVVGKTYSYLNNMRKQIKENVLFDMKWNEDGEWRYEFRPGLGLPRCYAHEFREKIKDEGKQKEYDKSPLVLVERNASYISKIMTIPDGYFTIERLHYVLTGRLHENTIELEHKRRFRKITKEEAEKILLDGEFAKAEEKAFLDFDENGDKSFSFGLAPSVPSNANFEIVATPCQPIRFLLALCGLGLFQSYISGRNIVVDGYRGRVFIVPLSKETIALPQFQLFHRHPHLWDFWTNRNFWRRVGVNSVRRFTQKKIGKNDRFFE